MDNLLENLPESLPEELVETLLNGEKFRLERIVSRGHASPPGFWYDQVEHEWVGVLAGAARLRFDDGGQVELAPGSCVNIPARRRHRVEWTAPDQPTVWLAVHFAAGPVSAEGTAGALPAV